MAQEQRQQEFARKWGQLVAKAWGDPAFKQRLLADPAAILRAEGIDVPAGRQVKVVENTDQVVYLTIPAKPPEAELSDEQLGQVAGGSAATCYPCYICNCARCVQ
jgi:hypothetical protein